MVAGAGSDRDYAQDIPVRVSHLETSVNQLHIDNQRTQTTLAGISAEQSAQSRLLGDIATKLDQTRTQKPNLTVLVSGIGVLITMSVLAFSPVYREMNAFEAKTTLLATEAAERSKQIATTAARLDFVAERQLVNEQRLLATEANRFTKQDAQRLEDNIQNQVQYMHPQSHD